MDREFELFPDQASTFARDVDALYLTMIGITAFFTVLICVLIVSFAFRYRQGSRASREFTMGHRQQMTIEILWSVIPLGIVLCTFVWGAKIYFRLHEAPPHAREVTVVAKQWMWRFQHEEGRREIAELHVPVGQPVKLNMISEDVIHSLYIPAFRTKMDVLPGRYTSLWFEASRPGTYHLFCAEYCGTSHAAMIGKVYVQKREDFAEWVDTGTDEAPADVGRRLVERFQCDTCHALAGTGSSRAPGWIGLYGRTVPLQGGGSVIADPSYLRESILEPSKKIVDGYRAVMPSYEGQISEEEILALTAYLRSLARPQTSDAPEDAKPDPAKMEE